MGTRKGDSSVIGIVALDKPEGMTSQQAVTKVRRLTNAQKAGHAGTLDPGATGLLIVLLGRVTRLASYAESGTKTYEGTFELGKVSTTLDCWGEVEATGAPLPSPFEVCSFAPTLQGMLDQIPPQVSAIKQGGVPSYERARRGEEFTLPSRKVVVHSFTVSHLEGGTYSYSIHCEKGTYVRSLIRDVGLHFGCGAIVTSLRRTASFPFHAQEAVSFSENSIPTIRPWWELFPNSPRIMAEDELFTQLRAGNDALLLALIGEQRENGKQCASSVHLVVDSTNRPRAVWSVDVQGEVHRMFVS